MGVLDAEISAYMQELNETIDEAMKTRVTDAAKGYIQAAVIMEVYEKYPESKYERKLENRGLLDMREPPIGSMKSEYDPKTKTLTVEDVRPDWEPVPEDGRHAGRNVAEVVERTLAYDWWDHPFRRPFHKVAEKNLIAGKDVDFQLEVAYQERMGTWSR